MQANGLSFWDWRHHLQTICGGLATVRSQHYGNHKNVEGITSTLCHMCNQQHHPSQNLGQAEASTGTETATLDHHPHNPAFSQGLAGTVSLLTDSVTNP